MYKNRTHIFFQLQKRKGQIAVLIDPDKIHDEKSLNSLVKKSQMVGINYFFVGGSTVTREDFERVVHHLKRITDIPIVIFPGSSQQISKDADAILLLSLLSGRNPDYLIGHHIQASRELHQLDLEVIPTAYLLIDGGTKSSVAYVSQTLPIPNDQDQIALQTAIAGVMLGKRIIYYDAGSGAKYSVPLSLIKSTFVELPQHPIIVGGGIKTIEQIKELRPYVNVLVIGNHIEENEDFLLDLLQLDLKNCF